jgi:hypothetical protein
MQEKKKLESTIAALLKRHARGAEKPAGEGYSGAQTDQE